MRPGTAGSTGWDWCRPEGDPGHGRDRRRPGCLIGKCRGTGKCRIVTDHPLKWARELLGNAEIDRRFSVLQKRVGFRHFRHGFTRFRQHTGREQREIERAFICVISGHQSIKPRIMKAFRALMDFIYLAQYESHSSETIQYLGDALTRFHEHKDALSKSGVRDGIRRKGLFNIKKLELMHHVPRLIKQLGSAMQYSTEQTERCHIEMAKIPYESTNKRDFATQMCRYLDRREKIRLFTTYQLWLDCEGIGQNRASEHEILDSSSSFGYDGTARHGPTGIEGVGSEDSNLEPQAPTTSRNIHLEVYNRLVRPFLPKPTPDYFQKDVSPVPRNETSAFILTHRVPHPGVHVGVVSTTYGLPDFYDKLLLFHGHHCSTLHYEEVDIWNGVRIQLRAVQDEDSVLPPITVLACPMGPREGPCNFVLVKDVTDACWGIRGMSSIYNRGPCSESTSTFRSLRRTIANGVSTTNFFAFTFTGGYSRVRLSIQASARYRKQTRGWLKCPRTGRQHRNVQGRALAPP